MLYLSTNIFYKILLQDLKLSSHLIEFKCKIFTNKNILETSSIILNIIIN